MNNLEVTAKTMGRRARKEVPINIDYLIIKQADKQNKTQHAQTPFKGENELPNASHIHE